jgi:hypothetical protein
MCDCELALKERYEYLKTKYESLQRHLSDLRDAWDDMADGPLGHIHPDFTPEQIRAVSRILDAQLPRAIARREAREAQQLKWHKQMEKLDKDIERRSKEAEKLKARAEKKQKHVGILENIRRWYGKQNDDR